jgi:hypothetical protein
MHLKEFLDEMRWTPNFFAKLCKLNPQTILNVLNGKKIRPRTAKIIQKKSFDKVKIDAIYSKKLLHQ